MYVSYTVVFMRLKARLRRGGERGRRKVLLLPFPYIGWGRKEGGHSCYPAERNTNILPLLRERERRIFPCSSHSWENPKIGTDKKKKGRITTTSSLSVSKGGKGAMNCQTTGRFSRVWKRRRKGRRFYLAEGGVAHAVGFNEVATYQRKRGRRRKGGGGKKGRRGKRLPLSVVREGPYSAPRHFTDDKELRA